jgi:hypothetical protein
MNKWRLLNKAFPERTASQQQMLTESTRSSLFAALAQARLWAAVALCFPFVFLLWPDFYSMDQPEVWGIPFFYWFQLMWIPITSLITLTLYWKRIEL